MSDNALNDAKQLCRPRPASSLSGTLQHQENKSFLLLFFKKEVLSFLFIHVHSLPVTPRRPIP
jgi:hypothetical protein